MEIIKVGTKNRIKGICYKCGTEFIFDKDEIKKSITVSMGHKIPIKSGKFVGCPSCNVILQVKNHKTVEPSEELKDEIFSIRFAAMTGKI